MFKRLLVGVDGSKSGWTSCHYAFEFASKLDIPVVGIHIVDERLIEESFLEDLAGVLGFTFYYGASSKVREFLEAQADELLHEFLSLGRQRGLKVSSFQTVGVPYKEIVSQADKEDIIFLGKRGKRPIEGFLLGSNADMVARRSPCAVFLSPEEERSIRKVCVAYDGRQMSKKAMSVAQYLKPLFGFELEAIYVGEDNLSEDISQKVDHYEHLKGFPEEKIVEYCKGNNIDLLIMGAFSKGRFKEFFFGSVTSFVMHHLDIPMLLVK
ncbi:universal stress protein [Hydrogenobacter thermophilus]|uniref:universal stress protein n=1 Tax=Hydrogenobacter thermophilus TaxID=940 RepID=UPI0030F99E65